jgi:hypothetical protein
MATLLQPFPAGTETLALVLYEKYAFYPLKY